MEELDPTELLLRRSRETLSKQTKQDHLALLAAARTQSQLAPVTIQRTAAGRRRRRYVVGGVAAVSALLLGGGVAVAWVQSQQPTAPADVHCYAIATDDFDNNELFQAVALAVDSEQGRAMPVESCAAYWRAGLLSKEPPYVSSDPDGGRLPGDRPVPPLVACVLPAGNVGVFPEVRCSELRLPESTN